MYEEKSTDNSACGMQAMRLTNRGQKLTINAMLNIFLFLKVIIFKFLFNSNTNKNQNHRSLLKYELLIKPIDNLKDNVSERHR